MMKLVIIADVHGRSDWKKITAFNEDADTFIFLGDYFDSEEITAEQQLTNFKEIILFKQQHAAKVILLTGNHDIHYHPWFINKGEKYSGFQELNSVDITEALQLNLSHLQMAYRYADFLFTHAGVTNTWLNDHGFDKAADVVQFINDKFIHEPGCFAFAGFEPSGDSRHSSPVWVRPRSMMSNAYKYTELKQVVGHTRHKRITIIKGRYYFVDAPESSEYLVINNEVAQVMTY